MTRESVEREVASKAGAPREGRVRGRDPVPDIPARVYRSVPMPDGSVALEVPDGAVILATPAGWCRRCNARSVPDPKRVHACARCRVEPIPGQKAERARKRAAKRRLPRGWRWAPIERDAA